LRPVDDFERIVLSLNLDAQSGATQCKQNTATPTT
jgi:hypothetical protein